VSTVTCLHSDCFAVLSGYTDCNTNLTKVNGIEENVIYPIDFDDNSAFLSNMIPLAQIVPEN
jgi:hypothetical protein